MENPGFDFITRLEERAKINARYYTSSVPLIDVYRSDVLFLCKTIREMAEAMEDVIKNDDAACANSKLAIVLKKFQGWQ